MLVDHMAHNTLQLFCCQTMQQQNRDFFGSSVESAVIFTSTKCKYTTFVCVSRPLNLCVVCRFYCYSPSKLLYTGAPTLTLNNELVFGFI